MANRVTTPTVLSASAALGGVQSVPTFTPTKRCRVCQQDLPMDDATWYKSKTSPDGYVSLCKPCYKTTYSAKRSQAVAKAQVEEGAETSPDQTTVTPAGYIASKDLLKVWGATLAARDADGHAMNLLFLGPSGSGKTEGAKHLAQSSGLAFTKVDAAAMTDPESWFGTREVVAVEGVPVTVYRPSAFVLAIQQPGVLLIDEVNRVRDEHRNILLPLLDGTHQVSNPLNGEIVAKDKDCIVIMSGNRGLQFTGTYAVDPALMTRALTLEFGYLGPEDEIRVARSVTGCTEDHARLFVRFASETRSRTGTDPDMIPLSTREVIAACRLVAKGLNPDLAASVAMINSSSDEGGPAAVRTRLINIWAGIRKGK